MRHPDNLLRGGRPGLYSTLEPAMVGRRILQEKMDDVLSTPGPT